MTQDGRDARIDLGGDRFDDRPEPGGDPGLDGVIDRTAFAQPGHRAVGEGHLQRDEVLDGAPEQDAVGTRGVVADHPTERGVARRGDIGTEHEPMRRERRIELVKHHTGLDDRAPGMRVDGFDHPTVLAEVDDDGAIDGLAGECRATAARKHRDPAGQEPGSGLCTRFRTARQHDAQGLDLVDARIRRIEHAVVSRREHLDARHLASKQPEDLGVRWGRRTTDRELRRNRRHGLGSSSVGSRRGAGSS